MGTKNEQPPSRQKPRALRDAARPFYFSAIEDVVQRGEMAEIHALIKGAKQVKSQYGDLDSLIANLEAAANKAR